MERERELVLAGLLALLVAISVVTLLEIINVVVFAVTVAYVLYPIRMQLTKRGASKRVASALATSAAFLVVVALVAPILYVANRRRGELLEVLSEVPETITLTAAGMETSVETETVVETIEEVTRDVAVQLALAAPGLVLELAVFTLLLYGMLLRPGPIRVAVFELVPSEYHDIVSRLHQRTRSTLYSIYVIQAATAAGTAVIALGVFLVLGYSAPLALAVISGILQFIPILGPSILILGLAAFDAVLGDPTRAVTVTVVGLVFIGFVPDAIIRTRLAGRTGELAASLYFVGFVGGILTIGAIGIIVGPLVVALLVEVVDIISEHGGTEQATIAESVEKSATPGDDEATE